MATKIEIEVKLSAEDRALLTAVNTNLTKAAGKAAPGGGGKGSKSSKTPEPEEPTIEDNGDAADEFEGEGGDAADEFEGEGDDTEKTYERSDVHNALKAYATVANSSAEAIKVMAKRAVATSSPRSSRRSSAP
jgi:hypothetical protein